MTVTVDRHLWSLSDILAARLLCKDRLFCFAVDVFFSALSARSLRCSQ